MKRRAEGSSSPLVPDAVDIMRIVAMLRDSITDGSLPPGTRLRHGGLAAELGATRAQVREAMRYLETEGELSSIDDRSSVVTSAPPGAVSEAVSVRARIEPYAVERSLPVLIADGFSHLEFLLDQLAKGMQSASVSVVVDSHLAFHRAFYEQADHRLLLETWRTLELTLRHRRKSTRWLAEHGAHVVSSHQELLDVLKTGSLSEIVRRVAEHIDDAHHGELTGRM